MRKGKLMTDEPNTNEQVQQTSPAGAQNSEHMIPKSRFDEVNNKYKEAMSKLEERERVDREAAEKRLEESQRYKELSDQRAQQIVELQSKADKADQQESALQAVLDARVQEIPEDMRDVVPEGDVIFKLNWITRNMSKILKPVAPDIGAGTIGSNNIQTNRIELSPEEREVAKKFGMSEEEYAKYK